MASSSLRSWAPITRESIGSTVAPPAATRFSMSVYDEAVAERLGDLLAAARATGRRAGAMDAIIAVTAVVHDLTVWTQDNDFETLAELLPALRVLRG